MTMSCRSDLGRAELYAALTGLLTLLDKPRRRAVAVDAGWQRGETLPVFLDRLSLLHLRALLDDVLDAWNAQRAAAAEAAA
jgi:hypothetical protein